MESASSGNEIKVAIRVRPLLQKERTAGLKCRWACTKSTIWQCHDNQGPNTTYAFDHVFDENVPSDVVYHQLAEDIVKQAMIGFNGTVFTYGQSGSGKTYTIDAFRNLAIQTAYECIENCPTREFVMRASYLEIFNEKLTDLLSDNAVLNIREDVDRNVRIDGLTEVVAKSQSQIKELLDQGNARRQFAETKLNERSSRAHCIFRLMVESRVKEDTENSAAYVSCLNLVDLAGSERAGDNSGDRLREGVSINLSLLTLSQVIRKLSSEQRELYINYRDSKLTRILQTALEGNSKTAILCTVAPFSVEETHSTLKFALNAKKVKTKPQQNEMITESAQLKKAQTEITKLKNKIKELEVKSVATDQEIRQEARENLMKFLLKPVLQGSSKAREEKQGRNKPGETSTTELETMFLNEIEKEDMSQDQIFNLECKESGTLDSESAYGNNEAMKLQFLFQRRLESLRTRIDVSNQKVSELQQEKCCSCEDKMSGSDEVKGRSKQLDSVTLERAELEKEWEMLRRRQADLSTLEENVELKIERLYILEDQKVEFEQEKEDFENKKSTFEQEKNKLRLDKRKLRIEMDTFEQEKNRFEQGNNRMKQEIGKLRQENERLEVELKKFQLNKDMFELAQNELKQETDNSKQEVCFKQEVQTYEENTDDSSAQFGVHIDEDLQMDDFCQSNDRPHHQEDGKNIKIKCEVSCDSSEQNEFKGNKNWKEQNGGVEQDELKQLQIQKQILEEKYVVFQEQLEQFHRDKQLMNEMSVKQNQEEKRLRQEVEEIKRAFNEKKVLFEEELLQFQKEKEKLQAEKMALEESQVNYERDLEEKRLRQEVEEMKKNLKTFNEEKVLFEEELLHFQKEKEKLRYEKIALEESQVNYERDMDSLQDKIKLFNEGQKKWKENCKEEKEMLRESWRVWTENSEIVNQRNEELLEKEQHLVRLICSHEEDRCKLAQEQNQLKQLQEDFVQRLASIKDTEVQLERELLRLQEEQKKLYENQESLKKEKCSLSMLEKKLNEERTHLTSEWQTLRQAQQSLKEQEHNIRIKSDKLETLSWEHEKRVEEQNRHRDSSEQLQALEEQLRSTTYELEEALDKVQELDDMIATGKDMLADRTETARKAEERAQELQSAVNELMTKLELQKTLIENQNRTRESLENRCSSMANENEKLKKQVADLKNHSNSAHYEDRIQKMEQKLLQYKNRDSQLIPLTDAERNRMKFDMLVQQREITELKKKVEEQKNQIANLQSGTTDQQMCYNDRGQNLLTGSLSHTPTTQTRTDGLVLRERQQTQDKQWDIENCPPANNHNPQQREQLHLRPSGGCVESFVIAVKDRKIRDLKKMVQKLQEDLQQIKADS